MFVSIQFDLFLWFKRFENEWRERERKKALVARNKETWWAAKMTWPCIVSLGIVVAFFPVVFTLQFQRHEIFQFIFQSSGSSSSCNSNKHCQWKQTWCNLLWCTLSILGDRGNVYKSFIHFFFNFQFQFVFKCGNDIIQRERKPRNLYCTHIAHSSHNLYGSFAHFCTQN